MSYCTTLLIAVHAWYQKLETSHDKLVHHFCIPIDTNYVPKQALLLCMHRRLQCIHENVMILKYVLHTCVLRDDQLFDIMHTVSVQVIQNNFTYIQQDLLIHLQHTPTMCDYSVYLEKLHAMKQW